MLVDCMLKSMNDDLVALLQECDALKVRLSECRPLPAEAFQKLVVKAEVESLKRYLSVLGVTGFDENR